VVSYRRRFVLRLWSFVVRTTGVTDEDHRPTITHELNLIRDRRDDLTAYPAHEVHLVHARVYVRTALKVQDRATFWLRQGLQGYALTVAISTCHGVILAGQVARTNGPTKRPRCADTEALEIRNADDNTAPPRPGSFLFSRLATFQCKGPHIQLLSQTETPIIPNGNSDRANSK
jgi:hypothetical protein